MEVIGTAIFIEKKILSFAIVFVQLLILTQLKRRRESQRGGIITSGRVRFPWCCGTRALLPIVIASRARGHSADYCRHLCKMFPSPSCFLAICPPVVSLLFPPARPAPLEQRSRVAFASDRPTALAFLKPSPVL